MNIKSMTGNPIITTELLLHINKLIDAGFTYTDIIQSGMNPELTTTVFEIKRNNMGGKIKRL